MGNDMFNDEQLAHMEIVQKETEDAVGFWKERALKAEAALDAAERERDEEFARAERALDEVRLNIVAMALAGGEINKTRAEVIALRRTLEHIGTGVGTAKPLPPGFSIGPDEALAKLAAAEARCAELEAALREIGECICQRNWYTAGRSLNCLDIATVVPCASCIARRALGVRQGQGRGRFGD